MAKLKVIKIEEPKSRQSYKLTCIAPLDNLDLPVVMYIKKKNLNVSIEFVDYIFIEDSDITVNGIIWINSLQKDNIEIGIEHEIIHKFK